MKRARAICTAIAAIAVTLTIAPHAHAAGTNLPGQPFPWDDVRVLDGTGANARVHAGAESWTKGTGITIRWVPPEWSWDVYIRPDYDHELGSALGAYRITRTGGATGYVESCTVLYRQGLSGATRQTIVARYMGRCLGWTGKAHGRSIFNGASAPTRHDLRTMRRIYATNPVEQP